MLVNKSAEKPCPNCNEIHPHKPNSTRLQCQACGHAWMPCRKCGAACERAREVYEAPTCYRCLPPPPKLRIRSREAVIEWLKEQQHSENSDDIRDGLASQALSFVSDLEWRAAKMNNQIRHLNEALEYVEKYAPPAISQHALDAMAVELCNYCGYPRSSGACQAAHP